ncbi:MAG: FAD:protein FMN transferase [Rhizobiaceae bacterium]|nr:FAD:protein FMN transferase [Rhizobiaceae bacterium]
MIDRRRFIAISAAAAGCSLLGQSVTEASARNTVVWRGKALGAIASLSIHHHDRASAERLVRQVVTETERLEQVFSLYRSDSSLSRLNRLGALAAPPADLITLLERCRVAWELTDGVFDPTVQPLWRLLADHFSRAGVDQSGPVPEEIRKALSLVGFDKVVFDRNRVSFGKRGMALTFNGIAQGYITDRAVNILRRGGIETSIVDMGEIRALGSKPDGEPWLVGIRGAQFDQEPHRSISIVNKAAATSSGKGFAFDTAMKYTHLLDPRDGSTASGQESVTVIAPDAVSADALSTAFGLMSRDAIRLVSRRRPGIQAFLTSSGGVTSAL